MSIKNIQDSNTNDQSTFKITPQQMGVKSSMIANMPICSISWADFKGDLPTQKKYYAHMNWHITYSYFIQRRDQNKVKVLAKPHISSKSYVDPQHKQDYNLLRHEYGHYLIGCLCCLNFQKKISQNNKKLVNLEYKELNNEIRKIFRENLSEYLEIEIKYDEQTNHYYNREQQQKWQKKIAQQINQFYRIPLRQKKYSQNKQTKHQSLQKPTKIISQQVYKQNENKQQKKIIRNDSYSKEKNRKFYSRKSMRIINQESKSIGKKQSHQSYMQNQCDKKNHKNIIKGNIRLASALPPRARRKSQKQGMILPQIKPIIQIR